MFNYVTATYNVLCDKIVDAFNTEPINIKKHANNDKMSDHQLNCNEFQEENEVNTRIYEEVPLFKKIVWLYSDPINIIDNIYLGSAINASCKSTIDNYNISLIINVTAEISNKFESDIDYKTYNLYDNNEHTIEDELEDAYKTIIESQMKGDGKNILIHCFMGLSRSVTVILYYIMRCKRLPNGDYYNYKDALELIKQKKPDVNPTFRMAKDCLNAIKKHRYDEEDSKFNIKIYDDIIEE
ncbi:dual specificity phosphatase [Hokovirus HKV1]|uniref:Dual specificity phosphatase n=1 Tax=Hokovirus HKV1 TaxID=1977638 RepID=A0A1V0SHB5_9VIRU|nr:dual specificity phosphatase [Hokovirus HKV1]